jgi:hypothetical protein
MERVLAKCGLTMCNVSAVKPDSMTVHPIPGVPEIVHMVKMLV